MRYFHFCVAAQLYHLYGIPLSALLIMSRPDREGRGGNIRSDDDQSLLLVSLQLPLSLAHWGAPWEIEEP